MVRAMTSKIRTASLTLKVSADTKARLEAEARRNGLTNSEQAERCLAASFDKLTMLQEALVVRYGKELGAYLFRHCESVSPRNDKKPAKALPAKMDWSPIPATHLGPRKPRTL